MNTSAEQGRGEFSVGFRFSAELSVFLKARSSASVARVLREKTSVKDAIEGCGVPHVEVDLILCEGRAVGFEHHLDREALVRVYGVESVPKEFLGDRLQRQHMARFVADGHLGKLVRDLRLLGVDVAYAGNATDEELAKRAAEEERALLTRDRRLLMRAAVRDGYWLRSQVPEEQTVEVIRRFELGATLTPFTRCLKCNGVIEQVEKSAVLEQLEPLTQKYYQAFRRCRDCEKIYWPGSHFEKLKTRIARLRSGFPGGR